MNLKESEAMAEGCYVSVQIVAKYMENCLNNLIDPVLPNKQTGYRDDCIKSLYLRVLAWLQTLEKMNHAVCSQGVLSGTRSIFEIVVDLILLHQDKTEQSGLKMYWFSQSERLRSAEQTIEYYAKNNHPLPDHYEPRKSFYEQEAFMIKEMRGELWPDGKGKGKHPNRWTGKTFPDDIQQADLFFEKQIRDHLGESLEEMYRTEYKYDSWFVHSGITSVWNLPPEHYNLTCGRSFLKSSDLGMLCVKIILKDFGLTAHLPNLDSEWARLKELRAQSFFEVRAKRLEGKE